MPNESQKVCKKCESTGYVEIVKDGQGTVVPCDCRTPTPTVPTLGARIDHLLKQIGDPQTCRGCGADIWFIEHRNGKRAPYTRELLNHFIDCPAAKQFQKGSQHR